MLSRRNFIKSVSIGSAGLISLPLTDNFAFTASATKSELHTLSAQLLHTWAEKLISLQVTDQSKEEYGGILCPANKIVHGRIGDTIYPFLHLAHSTNDSKYIDASILLYRWMEKHVSQEDGSWLNEPVKGSWKGTTVFSIIALAESINYHGAIIDPAFKTELTNRLHKAGEFVYTTFNIDYGNINYPIAAAYGLTLLGEVLDISKYKVRGRELAHQALKFITPADKFIFGEGDPYYEKSKKGCLSIDLGYNVEESLPSLALYGLLTNDEEVLQPVVQSMQAHMEFMLPDGGWDNSWGTRNYKWTYWGSRTSDGCQPAYALLADRDPRFYKAALRNTQLLERCTKEGLLSGGLHYASHHVATSVHHTFCHIKALTTILDHGHLKKIDVNKITLPREKEYGSKFFSDTQTWLIAKGKFKATITAYDREYKKTKNGHASGGALTMLWHEKTGIIFCASMNEYQLFEAGNMQPDSDSLSMPLTPRIELKAGDKVYMNSCDLEAQMELKNTADQVCIKTRSRLVDKDQNSPPSGAIICQVDYTFSDESVTIHFSYDNPNGEPVRIIFPVISPGDEKIKFTSGNRVDIEKEKSTLTITSTTPILQLPTHGGRIFNYVPGLEAIPLSSEQKDTQLEIKIN